MHRYRISATLAARSIGAAARAAQRRQWPTRHRCCVGAALRAHERGRTGSAGRGRSRSRCQTAKRAQVVERAQCRRSRIRPGTRQRPKGIACSSRDRLAAQPAQRSQLGRRRRRGRYVDVAAASRGAARARARAGRSAEEATIAGAARTDARVDARSAAREERRRVAEACSRCRRQFRFQHSLGR